MAMWLKNNQKMMRLSQLLISQILAGVSLCGFHTCTPTRSARHCLFSRWFSREQGTCWIKAVAVVSRPQAPRSVELSCVHGKVSRTSLFILITWIFGFWACFLTSIQPFHRSMTHCKGYTRERERRRTQVASYLAS
jgi:hypothetical protein